MPIWFLAAVVAHDLVLFPRYAGVDRVIGAMGPRRLVNYLRVPLLGAGLTFLMFFPGIGQGGSTHPPLGRWLAGRRHGGGVGTGPPAPFTRP